MTSPIAPKDFLLDDVETVSRTNLAYIADSNAHHNFSYSLATLLYRCIKGTLPWQYEINWKDTNSSVLNQVYSQRSMASINQSVISPYIPQELEILLDRTLTYCTVDGFANKLNRFINTYYEFTQFNAINISSSGSYEADSRPNENTNNDGLSGIAGMSEIKETLTSDIIEPLTNKDTYQRYGIQPINGILFYGPPGCGKTFIARQLAKALGYTFFDIKPSDLASTYIHGTQQKIGELFQEAYLKAPSVIFIDEADALLPSRDEPQINQHYLSEVNEFLAQLADCADKGILVILATNRPEKIDKSVLRTGRIDKSVYITLPCSRTRKDLLSLFLVNKPIDSSLDIDLLSLLLSGYSSSDIKYIVNEAAKLALKTDDAISQKVITEAIHNNKPSVDYKQIEQYEHFANSPSF